MRFLMKERFFAIGEDFDIQDEHGNVVFHVDGKAFTIRDQLSFQDAAGNELVYIRQKLLAIGRTYEITRGGELVAAVKKDLFNLFRCSFTVDVPGPDDLSAEGSLLDHEYTFRRGDRVVATVSKRWFSFRDTYGVEIAEGEDAVPILASAVVIEMACHGEK